MPTKKDPNKPRGRMTGYAYFVQTCREEHKRKHPNEQVVFAEFSRKCAKRWKPMTDKEKKTFTDMAEKDRQRYEREMKDYVPAAGEAKKKKKKKDPNAPKRPQSAFFLFCADRRAPLKAENPGWTVGEIAKALGKKWAAASPDTKKKYAEQGEVEKSKYNKEMEKYRSQQEASNHGDAKRQKMSEKATASSSASSSESESDIESD
uniref:Transcription factor protein n=1 Tax=Ciona intestinalis TaxID=7719 RepID=Q4H3E0_CIOIN|nr:transcription factor protein [Ciona intestinalis]BAE06487.1 transcription factor protein [Ciona intestinalis]|eukprot:NP_001071733.1 transcription factor protein [Ciona intestinalis]